MRKRCIMIFNELTSAVSLIFLPKTLIWNKTMFPSSNSLNLAKLMVNDLMKSIFKRNLSIFSSNLLQLNVKISRIYT